MFPTGLLQKNLKLSAISAGFYFSTVSISKGDRRHQEADSPIDGNSASKANALMALCTTDVK
jgi:hypothetical protein